MVATARIADEHGLFSRICQVTPIYNERFLGPSRSVQTFLHGSWLCLWTDSDTQTTMLSETDAVQAIPAMRSD